MHTGRYLSSSVPQSTSADTEAGRQATFRSSTAVRRGDRDFEADTDHGEQEAGGRSAYNQKVLPSEARPRTNRTKKLKGAVQPRSYVDNIFWVSPYPMNMVAKLFNKLSTRVTLHNMPEISWGEMTGIPPSSSICFPLKSSRRTIPMVISNVATPPVSVSTSAPVPRANGTSPAVASLRSHSSMFIQNSRYAAIYQSLGSPTSQH